mmetsp:Transcript_25344/g.46421  ORF Transcript_25344/g.46421 Transcript_25344/m.46421 type:complete len:250 (-) Transcript_25344:220-969(-)
MLQRGLKLSNAVLQICNLGSMPGLCRSKRLLSQGHLVRAATLQLSNVALLHLQLMKRCHCDLSKCCCGCPAHSIRLVFESCKQRRQHTTVAPHCNLAKCLHRSPPDAIVAICLKELQQLVNDVLISLSGYLAQNFHCSLPNVSLSIRRFMEDRREHGCVALLCHLLQGSERSAPHTPVLVLKTSGHRSHQAWHPSLSHLTEGIECNSSHSGIAVGKGQNECLGCFLITSSGSLTQTSTSCLANVRINVH